jgi:uncharacterized cupin superfamily protein
LVPERVLTVRLDGSADYQTGDGEERRLPVGNFVLFEDTDGKGHKTRHSSEQQTVIWSPGQIADTRIGNVISVP